jgi:hypothetical protein
MYYMLFAPGIDRQMILDTFQPKRNRRGISLSPAAFLTRGTLWPRVWGSRADHLDVAAVDPVAALDRVNASPAEAGVDVLREALSVARVTVECRMAVTPATRYIYRLEDA